MKLKVTNTDWPEQYEHRSNFIVFCSEVGTGRGAHSLHLQGIGKRREEKRREEKSFSPSVSLHPFFYQENGDCIFLRNVNTYVPGYTTS
jgi:hypothetical protein